ncbi:hypothetical protein GCM10023231_32150 [Olivibacter ginsenosidimutans]|uniref:Uncharacterized protein n=2 Tax=Olivibacter ginsenosidimutans TaxID=1176537 RepID=A0ABP9BV68_9SPHI
MEKQHPLRNPKSIVDYPHNDTTAIFLQCLSYDEFKQNSPQSVALQHISISSNRASCLVLNKKTGLVGGFKLEKEGDQWIVLAFKTIRI